MGDFRHIDLPGQQPLPDTTKICRYVSLRTLFHYLSGKIFVPSIKKLRDGDPFEAKVYYDDPSAQFQVALRERYGSNEDEILDWIEKSRFEKWQQDYVHGPSGQTVDHNHPFFPQHYFKFILSTRYAWCWFEPEQDGGTVIESAAMWNTFGKDGALVVSSVKDMLDELKQTPRSFEYGRVRYEKVGGSGRVSIPAAWNPGSKEAILRPYFLKRAEFQSEREIRFVTADFARKSEGVLIELKPDLWIDEIRLWPGLASPEADALKTVIRNLGFTKRCERSGMLKRCEDDALLKIIEGVMETSWQTGSDGVPSVLKSLWSKE